MAIIIRPAGATDLSAATIHAETGLPQNLSGLAAGNYEVGRVTWAAPVTVTTAALPNVALQHMQLGGATETTATVSVRGASAASEIRLRTSTNSDMSGATLTAPVTPDATTFVAKIPLTGLNPGVTTYYQARINGYDVGPIARYRPVAEKTAAAFKVAFGSCCTPNTATTVFARMAARNPDLLLSLGDTPYVDTTVNDPADIRTRYSNYYAQAGQADLLSKTCHSYVWDDHDFYNNDADANALGAPASKQVYRELQPHYPLNDAGAIYHAFTRGRVRFIMLDVRSERLGSTFLGTNQLNWLYAEIDAVASDPGLEGIVLATVSPWIASSGTDNWAGANTQRTAIGQRIIDRGLQGRTLGIAGDAHMVAFDSGVNNTWGGFPIFQAAPWDRPNSVKGGPYSTGPFSGTNGQYGILDVTDNGTTVTINCRGYSGSDAQLFTTDVNFTGTKIPAGTPAAPANTVAPTVTGSTTQGQTLTVSNGTWTDTTSYAYKWRRDGVVISGATATTYATVAADLGKTITCEVTGTGAGGSTAAVSNGIGPIVAAGAFGETLQATATQSNGQANSLAIPIPAATTVGSLLVVAGSFDKEAPSFTINGAGGGWTIQEDVNDGSGAGAQFCWKIADGTETGNITVSITGVNNLAKAGFAFAEFRGPFAATPAGAEASSYSATARTSATATLVTTATEALALAIANNDSGGSQHFTGSGAPWSEVVKDFGVSSNPAFILSKAIVAAGSHGYTATHPVSDQIALFMVEMKKA